ncbi:MAG: hypothetical protein CMD79_01180 [Gammaproteobacteria bacterium]|nr:hypothetical protein [Gammaproteobacteria bacterium]
MKNTIQKLNPIFLLNTTVFIIGTVANIYFALLAAGYMVTILCVYLIGSKIKDHVIKIGYIWVAKWLVFVAFLMLSGIYLPEVFLYSLAMFVIFNLSVNPSNPMSKKEAQL